MYSGRRESLYVVRVSLWDFLCENDSPSVGLLAFLALALVGALTGPMRAATNEATAVLALAFAAFLAEACALALAFALGRALAFAGVRWTFAAPWARAVVVVG